MKKLLKILVMVLFVGLIGSFVGCEPEPIGLVGTWQLYYLGGTIEWTFYSNNSVSLYSAEHTFYTYHHTVNGTITTESSTAFTIYWSTTGTTATYNYSISSDGRSLTLSGSPISNTFGTSSVTFTRL